MGTIRLFGVDIPVREPDSPLSIFLKEVRDRKPIGQPAIKQESPTLVPIKVEPGVHEPQDVRQATYKVTPKEELKKKRKRTSPQAKSKENKENKNINIPRPLPRWSPPEIKKHKSKKKKGKKYLFPVKCLCAEHDNVFIHCSKCKGVRKLDKKYCLVHMNPDRVPLKFNVEITAEMKPPAHELDHYERAKRKWTQKIYNRLHVLMDHPSPAKPKVATIDPFDRWEMKGGEEDDDPYSINL